MGIRKKKSGEHDFCYPVIPSGNDERVEGMMVHFAERKMRSYI